MLYRSNIKRNSTAAQILETSYDVSEFPLFEMLKGITKPYPYAKKIALDLKYSGFLKSDRRGMYSMTQKGRWFAICQRLDGLSFLSLCLLAETYHKVKTNHEMFYQISTFRKYYEMDYGDGGSDDGGICSSTTAIYKRRNISRSLQLLRERHLVYVVSGEFIKMTGPMIDFLSEYDEDLDSLYIWNADTHERCISYTIANKKFNPNIVNLFSKGSN